MCLELKAYNFRNWQTQTQTIFHITSSSVGVTSFPQNNFQASQTKLHFMLTITRIVKKTSFMPWLNLNLLVAQPSVSCAEASQSVLDISGNTVIPQSKQTLI